MSRSIARQFHISTSDWEFLDGTEALLATAQDVESTCAMAAQVAVPRLCDSCTIEGFPNAPVVVRGRKWHAGRDRVVLPASDPDDGVAISESLVVSGQPVGMVRLYRLGRGWSHPLTSTVARLFVDTVVRKLAGFLEASGSSTTDSMVSVLVHELRNAITPLPYGLQILHHQVNDTAEYRATLDRLERQVRELGGLLDGMLELFRADLGKMVLKVEPLDLETVAWRAVETVEPMIRERNHALSVCVQPGARRVLGDAQRLAQVLTNLLTNAAKYTEPGGEIDLRADRQGEAVLIRVRDSGVGMDPDLLPRVFDRFVQSAPSRSGLGVGLALVRRVVELHGGHVWANSDGPGRGSEFVVRLRTPKQEVLARPASFHQ